MVWITLVFSIIFGLSAIGIVLLVRGLTRVNQKSTMSMETLAELSIDRYRPMLRLLDDDDLRFLRVQPGFTPVMATELRRQRCKIFRGYLKCLATDFACVCGALKMLILESRYDRPDLASALVTAQYRFTVGLAVVQFRLALYQWGLSDVDAAGLLRVFDSMRMELRTLVPAGSAS